MSLYKKVKKIKGIIKIKVEGFFIERFVNLCLQKEVQIWEVERLNEGSIKAKIFYNNLEIVRQIVETTHCKIEILEKTGVPFYMNR